VISDASFSDLSNVTFSTPSVGTLSGGNWNIASLASGATDTITVTGTIINAGAFSNTASATTTTYQATDPTGAATTSTVSGTAVADANLTLSKVLQTTGTIYDGEHVTFQIQVGNTGPDAAQNVVISDSSFSDLSNVTFSTPTVGTLSGGNWNIASLASGATDTITVTGTISNAGAFSNTASATTTTYQATDPTGAATTSTVNGSAVADANLTLSKVLQTTGTIYDGEHVTFQIQVGNTGPDAAQNVVISDSSFSDLSNVTFSTPTVGTLSGGNWNIASLASGATDTITVTGTISNAGAFSNTASATTTTYQATDPTGTPVTAAANGTAVADANLTLSKVLQTTGTIYDGEHVTFQIQVGNTGPDAAQNVVISDSSFSDLSNVTFSTPTVGTLSGGNWNIASLASGATDTITVTGTITNAGAFSNTASATTTTYQATDPTGAATTSTVNGSAVADANLTLSKVLQTTGTIYDGEHVTFQIQVGNTGPDAAQNVVISDASFSDLSNVTFSTPTVGTLSGGNWNITSLASGVTDTITVTGTIAHAGAFSNTASAITTTYQAADPTGIAITASASGTAVAAANLTLTKTLQTTGTIYDGEHVTFQIQVSNTGPDAAQNVVVTDTTFADLSNITFGTAPTGTTASGGTWTIGSLASNATDTITVNGIISHAGAFSNTASLATSTYDLNTTTSSTVTGTAVSSCDLAVTINNSSVIPGANDTYTLTVTNNGPDAVNSFTLSNSLPAAFLNAAYTASAGSFNSSTGAWTGINLGTGQSLTLSIAGTLSSSATGSLVDSATVTAPSGVLDSNSSNNTASATATLTPQANLNISITPSLNVFTPGAAETYTITLKNTGPSDATNVSMVDALAAQGFLNVSSPNLPSGVTFNASTDTWTIGTLAAGATEVFQFTGTIPTGATGSSYIDQVSASASDAATVSAQSSILPSGIVTALPDVDTVSAVIGSTATANVITAADTNPSPGSHLLADQIDAYGGAHIVSASYGSTSQSFSVPSQVHTDTQGSYITLAGSYGNLNLYQNGNYTYTVTHLPASTGVSTLLDGSLAVASSSAAMQASWSNAGLYAYNFGTSFTDSAGHLNLAGANDQIVYDTSGIGVPGLQNQLTGPTNQINYDPTANQSEAMVVDLHTSATQATVTVSNLFTSEGTGEQGYWQAFNAAGVQVGEGLINAATTNYGSSDNVGTVNIQILGANSQPIAFEYLAFTALPYPNANPANNILTDAGDYYVRAIQYTTAPTTPNISDVFNYTVADSQNNQSSTTLTINGLTADLSASVVNSTQTPVPGSADTYTITVTNNGPSTVNSLVLTDSTTSGLNSLNQFITTLNNPVLNASSGSYNSTTGAWTGLSLASGQSVTLTVTGTINAAATGNILNTVTVANTTTGIADPVTTNNSAESNLALTPHASLALSMTATESTAIVGTTDTYAITITNTGPSNAYNVSVADSLPIQGLSNITSPNLPSGITFNATTDTWTIGTLAAGASQTVYLSGTVPTASTGTTYINQATATASDASSVTALNSSPILNLTAYSIVQEPGPAPYDQGDDAIYQINLATGAYTGIVPNSFNSDVGVGNVEANNHITAIAVDPLNGYIYAINNTGLLQIDPTNPQATTSYLSTSASIANIGLNAAITFSPVGVGSGETLYAVSETTTSPLYKINLSTGTATALGGALGHTITGLAENSTGNLYGISNGSTPTLYHLNTATGAILDSHSIVLPTGISGVSFTGLSFDATGTLWALDQAKGDIFSISLTLDANSHYDATLVSTYDTGSDGSGFQSLTFAPAGTIQQNSLNLTQTASAITIFDPSTSTSNETYTLTVTNTSGATATNIDVSDLLPSGISFTSSNASTGTYSNTTGLWSIASLASGASASLTVTGNVTALGSLVNSASIVYEDQQNLNASNNTAATTITSAEQHFTAMISDTSNSGSAVMVEAALVNATTPWDSAFAPVVLPAGGGQTYMSIPTDFNIQAGSQYSLALELAHGSSGQSVTINGFVPLFTDVINPASLSGATDSRYGSASSWTGGHGSMQLVSGSF